MYKKACRHMQRMASYGPARPANTLSHRVNTVSRRLPNTVPKEGRALKCIESWHANDSVVEGRVVFKGEKGYIVQLNGFPCYLPTNDSLRLGSSELVTVKRIQGRKVWLSLVCEVSQCSG